MNTDTLDLSVEDFSSQGSVVQKKYEAERLKKKEQDLDPQMKFFIEAGFHGGNINQIKKSLGKRCSFLAHEREGGKYFVKAIMKNETGGKDTVRFALGGTPSEMTEDDYRELYNQLKTMDYVNK